MASSRLARPGADKRDGGPRERAVLVGLVLRRSKKLDAEHSIDELAGLAEAAGAAVVLTMIQERPRPIPRRSSAAASSTSSRLNARGWLPMSSSSTTS